MPLMPQIATVTVSLRHGRHATLLPCGVSHCAVIVFAGTSTELVERYLRWNEQSKGVAVLKIACGILVMLGGVWLICSAL